MEFNEKLQELRKNKGLTQEELSECLFVSRTAVSKWESGRGYPSIDSLKEISRYFSISIDELLSTEKLIDLVEKENKIHRQFISNLAFAISDLCCFLLIILPLYPKSINDYIYSVNLYHYTQISTLNRSIYWLLFIALILCGIFNLLMIYMKNKKHNSIIHQISVFINILTLICLVIAKEVYSSLLLILILLIKGVSLLKYYTIISERG